MDGTSGRQGVGPANGLSRRRFLRVALGAQVLVWSPPAVVALRPGVAAAVSPPPDGGVAKEATGAEQQPSPGPARIPAGPPRSEDVGDGLTQTGRGALPLAIAGLGAAAGTGLLRQAHRLNSEPKGAGGDGTAEQEA